MKELRCCGRNSVAFAPGDKTPPFSSHYFGLSYVASFKSADHTSEYERLFRIIHAVFAYEKSDLSGASLFFAVAGAYLLSKHHSLKSACPVAGMAGYALQTPPGAPVVLGIIENGKPASDAAHFHCWIEADGWIIDLCAPILEAIVEAKQEGARIPPLMFQKPVLAGANVDSLTTPGAYVHVPNTRLTTSLMNGFSGNPIHADLVRVCDRWYARPPRKLAPSIAIADQHGKAEEVQLSPIRLAGAW